MLGKATAGFMSALTIATFATQNAGALDTDAKQQFRVGTAVQAAKAGARTDGEAARQRTTTETLRADGKPSFFAIGNPALTNADPQTAPAPNTKQRPRRKSTVKGTVLIIVLVLGMAFVLAVLAGKS